MKLFDIKLENYSDDRTDGILVFRLLADLQKGSQHLSSLQAAADAMNSVDLPLERAEALYRLGSCKVRATTFK